MYHNIIILRLLVRIMSLLYTYVRLRTKIFAKEERQQLIDARLLKPEDLTARELVACANMSRASTISLLPEELRFMHSPEELRFTHSL